VTLLVISPDYASHLFPLLALAGPWAARGERVVVATGPAVAPLVQRSGFEWRPLVLGRGSNSGTAHARNQPPGEDDNLRAFFEATRSGMLPTLRLQAQLRLNDLLWRPLEAARATLDAVRETAPDSILVDHLAFGATLGLRAAGIGYLDAVLGHPTALPVARERFGVPATWPAAFQPEPEEMVHLRQISDEVARVFTDDWNRAAREVNPAADAVEDAFRVHGDVVLYNYPAEMHDARRRENLPPSHEFLGSSVRTEDLDAEARAWLREDRHRPMVLVSFGSFLSARADVLARIASALRGTGVRVALASGSANRAVLGAVQAGWLVRPFLPQAALVRHAAVAITHGGNNGVTEALTSGVPVLALPFSTDQFAVASDLERAGLGRAHDPNRVTEREIREAVGCLLAPPNRAAAADLGRRLRADPGPARAWRAAATLSAAA